ncbi:MAG: ABC transporter permease [Proteiniphilum sp.]|jgi:putative ABC transport system permease protein|nr:ABC transporter permease [Proteiniphilum sp.]MDD3778695.1 ABC transporter permease [Proteiniphilum sp.]MDD3956619.1 ABC transporter permease [Proteiniphilum sp.]NCB24715.1 FtsX-like permease family protein [Bacteroidia bacterium]
MLSTAFKFVRFEKSKSMGILAAIVISIYLIGIELGMFFYLANIIGGIVGNANPQYAQVFVVKKQTENINQLSPLDLRWVNQLRSIDGVTSTHGFVITNVSARFPNGKDAPAVIIGSDYPAMAAGPYTDLVYSGSISSLVAPEIVSTDFYDNKTLRYEVKPGTRFEINGKSATVGVMTKDAKGFTSPLIYTSTDKARYYTGMSPTQVSGIIVTVPDASMIESVVSRINQIAPDLKAWPAEKIRTATIVNVMTANNMGMSFATLVLFGIISGFFIIGLTMYSVTYDRIKDYGTLKAIGASGKYITRLVVAQSVIYALIGYLVSLILLIISKIGMAKGGLIISLTPALLGFLFLTTLIISVGSSYFSIRKLKKVEPSSVFR